MQAVGSTHLILLLAAVAMIAGASGFLGSVVLRRKKRRARGFFVLGFLCGVTAVAILRVRRADAYRLAARVLSLAVPSGRDAGRSRSIRGLRTWRRLRLDV